MKKVIYKISLTSFFLALAFVLPFLTGQIPQIGTMLCPMHFPVLLCGFICGWKYGLIVGIIAPLLRSITIGMPSLFPTALCMSFELATYGFTSGMLYEIFPKKQIFVYVSLIISMIIGRLIWGVAMLFCVGFDFNKFNLLIFWTNGFVTAVPGIILQIILIPICVLLIRKLNKKNL